MQTALHALERMLVPRRRGHRPQLVRALRALRALLDAPDETRHAFEIGYALDGDRLARELSTLLRYETGRRLVREQPSLLAVVEDAERLRALPDGSLGRAYLAHLERNGLSAAKLVALRRATDPAHGARDATERWWVERTDLMHDFWHVLSGYDADARGEAALLVFTLAQRPTRSGALLSLGANVQVARLEGARWLAEVARAWRRGRRAAPLAALPYEELMAEPHDALCRAVGIRPLPAPH